MTRKRDAAYAYVRALDEAIDRAKASLGAEHPTVRDLMSAAGRTS